MQTASYWVNSLGLLPHPEGGFYREVHRSTERVPGGALPLRFEGAERSYLTSIYFLIQTAHPSHFHRIRSDEIWYFHQGDTVVLHLIDAVGTYKLMRLGDLHAGVDAFQLCIPAGTWFAAEVEQPQSYALVSCAVAPGFDFADFELAKAGELKKICNSQADLIDRLTYD